MTQDEIIELAKQAGMHVPLDKNNNPYHIGGCELEKMYKFAELLTQPLEADARRYRWLRNRLKVTKQQTMANVFKNGFEVRIGNSFFDCGGNDRKGYLDKDKFDNELIALDKAIDEALASLKEHK